MVTNKSKTNPELTKNIKEIWNGLDFAKGEDIKGLNSLVLNFRKKFNNLGINFINLEEYKKLYDVVNTDYYDKNGNFNSVECFVEIEKVLKEVFGII